MPTSPPLYHQVTTTLNTFPQLTSSSTIAIALSGGSDSMALLKLAHHWASTQDKSLIALTVDHGLRPESTKEAKQVSRWLKTWNIPHHILTWNKAAEAKTTGNLQANARDARYQLLTDYCHQHHITALLVAHQQDDQAETVLMRLARGSGVDGLAAMAPISYHHNIAIIRPLLSVSRQTLQDFLTAEHIPWLSDPSNEDRNYDRIKWRTWLAQDSSPNLTPARLSMVASQLSRTRDYLHQQTDLAITKITNTNDQGAITINATAFQTQHQEIQLRLLAKLLCTISSKAQKPRFEKLMHLLETILQAPNMKPLTLHGCYVRFDMKTGMYVMEREETAST